MRSYLRTFLTAACALVLVAAASVDARADKLADIISKGVVRVMVFDSGQRLFHAWNIVSTGRPLSSLAKERCERFSFVWK